MGKWCLSESIVRNTASTRVPCAVFEVKLAGSDNPAFMENLLGSGAIQDGHKFSKFLSGAAVCHANKINTLPYWASMPMFEPLFGRQVSKLQPKAPSNRSKPGKLLLDNDATRKMSEVTYSTTSETRKSSTFSLLSSISNYGENSAPKVAPIKRARVEVRQANACCSSKEVHACNP